MKWRGKVDPILRVHLEKQIVESVKYRDSYNKSSNPANAQLWITVANLGKDFFEINLKLDNLEKTLQEVIAQSRSKKIFTKK